MKKTSKILAVIIAVISITCLMAISASAAISCSSYYVFMNETENYKVGQIANIPASRYTADLASSDYGVQNTYTYSFSDSSMVKVSGEKVTFVKEGTLTLTIKHNQKFERTGKTSSHTDTIKINVSTEPIQTTNIKLDSGAFSGGKEFPAFTVVNVENCYVEEATFYKEMADYYVGDKLPSYRAGTTIDLVRITLKPKEGYFFGWGGTNDGKSYESNVYTIEYKGKKYKPYVVHDQSKSEMEVYVSVTFEEGEIYATTFKDLDAPYHCGPLDKTVTTNSDVELVSVKYTMFNKELTEFKKGDTVGITVRVKSKDPKNTFNANGYAYWMEQKMNSVNTKLISSTEAEYTFTYKVDAIDSQTIKWADFTMPGVFAGEPLPTNAFSATDGIVVKSVTWTPNDAKADANKEYTVKIEFGKKDEFVYADDFAEQGVVSINGERAKFVNNTTSSGGVKGKFETTKYYAEATYKPTVVVNTGTTTGTMTETTTGTITGTVTGTVTGTTTDTTVTDKVENTDKTANKDKAENTEKSVKDNPSNSNAGIGNGSGNAYRFPFTDVAEKQWYHESVKQAHKLGLINGKTATLYKPDDNMTFAEAVKLAVCMNILYNGGDPNKDITNGKDVWYSTYMTYALDNGIIDDDLTPKANEKITRKEYVYIFSKALPEKAFAKKNNIPSGSIPDIKEEKLAQDKAIYLFYRAGILSGVDSKGTFKPQDNIKRSEVAAILIRMMDATARVGAPKDLA